MQNFTINHLIKLLLLCSLCSLQSHAQAEVKVTYYIPDVLGSPVAATNEQGEVLWRKHYKPFGEEIEQDTASKNNHIGYTGHVHDRDTGLTYMRARYYDPVVGRFMAMDPVGVNPNDPRTFNRFAYANNNPYKYVDPDGRAALEYIVAAGTVLYVALAVYPGHEKRVDDLQRYVVDLQKGWSANTEDSSSDEATDSVDPVQERYPSLDAAVGSVNPLDDVELEGKTKDNGLYGQGFTEKWTGVDSDGVHKSAFKNTKTGEWTGGHESSRNNQND